MKKYFIYLLTLILALVLYNSLWATCPEDAIDLGICDTLHVIPWAYTDTCIIYDYPYADPVHTDTICINNPGEKFPCFVHVNVFVTHDSNTFLAWPGQPEERWVRDSITALTVFLGWTRTNPTAYCSLSTYWNENVVGKFEELYPRSMWHHFSRLGSDSLNRIEWLAEHSNIWGSLLVSMSSDSEQIEGEWFPPHVFMTLLSFGKRMWWQGNKILLATLTFRIEDSMTICIDSISKSSADHCGFFRYDAPFYFPRDNMPLRIWVGSPYLTDTLTIIAFSPVDLIVTDPAGDSIGLAFNTIPGAGYDTTTDWNHDGDKDDIVTIPNRLVGVYMIRVKPEPVKAGVYSLGIRVDGSAMTMLASGEPTPPPGETVTYTYNAPWYLRGDVNGDWKISITDVVYLINYLFLIPPGPAPEPLDAGDVNCDGVINVTDVVYLINYLFLVPPGPPPCS